MGQLLWPNLADAHDRQYFNRLIAEGHTRLATPLYAIALALVALACLLPGDFNRRGLGKRLLLASACGLATQALSVALPNLATGTPQLLPMLYIAPIGISLLAGFALQRGPGRIALRGLLRPADAA